MMTKLKSHRIQFSDDTTVVGLITDNNETAYREKVRDLAGNNNTQRNQD